MPISKEGTVRLYDAIAPLYSFFRKITHKSDDKIMPFMLNSLDPRNGEVILDAGTGPGIYAIKIAEIARDAQVYGIDLSPNFLKLAERNAMKAGFNHIKFMKGDVEDIPFNDHHFDKIVCAGVLSAIPNPEQAACEFYRVLKMGGRAVIQEPNGGLGARDRYFLLLLYAIGLINPKRRGFSVGDIPQYFFSQRSLRKILEGAGFERVEIAEVGSSICAICSK
ncbi:MAG: methyltransferase domain-containing protein [Actinomycetota bacterium]|nr:methyltransferase domain-containing protein [Actinomycetota bacterium]